MRLELNLPKIDLELQRCVLVSSCPKEDNSFPRLAEATLVDIRDEERGFNVQGVPLGGSLYVKKVLEETAGKVARFCEHVVHLIRKRASILLWNVRRGALASRARQSLGRGGRQIADGGLACHAPGLVLDWRERS